MPITQVELITISTVTIRSISRNSATDCCVLLLEHFQRKLAILVAPPDATEKNAIYIHNYNPYCIQMPRNILENLLPV